MVGYIVKISLLVCLVMSITSCKTQSSQLSNVVNDYDLPQKNKLIAIDDLGFLYLVSNINELIRYDKNLEYQYAYSNARLGSVYSIDVNNPFKLLVFYEDYQTIIVLDNLLGEIGRYNLFDLGFNDINAVGLSNDNNVWLYDPIDYKLKKINNNGELFVESITMYNEGLEHIKPQYLVERGNKVFLYDDENGFFVFDNLGQYIESIPIKGLTSYQVLNEKTIIFLKDGMIHSYDTEYKSTEVFKTISDYAKSTVDGFRISTNKIYLRNKEGILMNRL